MKSTSKRLKGTWGSSGETRSKEGSRVRADAPASAASDHALTSVRHELSSLGQLLNQVPKEIEALIPTRLAALRKTREIVLQKPPDSQVSFLVSIEMQRRELEGILDQPERLVEKWEKYRGQFDEWIRSLEFLLAANPATKRRRETELLLKKIKAAAALHDIERMQAEVLAINASAVAQIAILEEEEQRADETEYITDSVAQVLTQMGYVAVPDPDPRGASENDMLFLTPRGQAVRFVLDADDHLESEFYLVEGSAAAGAGHEAKALCRAQCEDLEELRQRLTREKGLELALESEIPADQGGYPVIDLPGVAKKMKAPERKIEKAKDVEAPDFYEERVEKYFDQDS